MCACPQSTWKYTALTYQIQLIYQISRNSLGYIGFDLYTSTRQTVLLPFWGILGPKDYSVLTSGVNFEQVWDTKSRKRLFLWSDKNKLDLKGCFNIACDFTGS